MTTQTDAPDQGGPGASETRRGNGVHPQDTAGRRHRRRFHVRVVVDLSADTLDECRVSLRDASLTVPGQDVILRTGAVGPAGLRVPEFLAGARGVELQADSGYPIALDQWRRELETLR